MMHVSVMTQTSVANVIYFFIIDVSQARYFVDEVKDKTGKDIDVSSWKKEFVGDLPVQKNGFVF